MKVDAQNEAVTVEKRKRGRPYARDTNAADIIKRAALKEFAKRGYQGASIDKIAKAAGVAKPLIHYHFQSKEALWKSSVSEAFDQLKKQSLVLVAESKNLDPNSFVDEFASEFVRFSAEKPWLVRISTDETRQGGSRSDWLKQNYLLPLHQIGLQFLGTISSCDEETTLRRASHLLPSLYGAINFPFIDADVVSEAYQASVFDKEYIKDQSRFIAKLIKASLQNYEFGDFEQDTKTAH